MSEEFQGPSNPNVRRNIALVALKGRLSYSIRIHRTDAFALSAVKGWAAKDGVMITTTRQGLTWVEAELDKIRSERESRGQTTSG